MLNITSFFNCHGREIIKYLKENKELKNYNIRHIFINYYVTVGQKFYKNTSLDKNDINILKETDILILQVIEKDRGFLNNNEVIKYCKKGCKIIKIPHYRNSVYEYKTLEGFMNKYDLIKNWKLPLKIKDIRNINETKKIIKNEINIMNTFPYDKEDMQKSLNEKINEFKTIDNLSDIKMFDFYKNNYKKYRLFQGRSYPSSRFFFELTNRILIYLGYSPNEVFKDLYFAENTGEPIADYWYNFCNFTFNKQHFIIKNLKIDEDEWYYLLLLSEKVNHIDVDENKKYLSMIRDY